jgi:hypothetical protein
MSLGLALACLLGLAFLAYLLLPIALEAGGTLLRPSGARSELGDLYIQREGTYATLKDLDFDFETGKLIEQDYRELRARYSAEAARILTRIDELEAGAGKPKRGAARESAAAKPSR